MSNLNKEFAFQVSNLRQIKAKFLSPTNTRGARLKIYEPKRYNDDKTESKIFSYCYETGDIMEQAFKILKNNGFNIVCRASDVESYIFLCDNWSDEFKKVSELKE